MMRSTCRQPNAGPHRVTVGGIDVAVETVGTGKPTGAIVAWLHGLGSSSTAGFATVARHAALVGTTSLLIDLPGHGLSAKPADWTYSVEDQATVVLGVLGRLSVKHASCREDTRPW